MKTLYVEPDTNASRAAANFRLAGDTVKASLMDKIALSSQAVWLGHEWVSDPTKTVDAAVSADTTKLRVFVVYDIVKRDVNAYSSGGAADSTKYLAFVAKIALGLKGRLAWFILEPDAIPMAGELDAIDQAKRFALLSAAVDILTAAGGRVYIDAGGFNWIPAATISSRLILSGIDRARGFSVNVSNSKLTTDCTTFANQIRASLVPHDSVHDYRFVIDTSRNGSGPPIGAIGEAMWCNPPSLRLGIKPTQSLTIMKTTGCDAFLWVKRPGESDGTCDGNPSAGKWSTDLALKLAGF